MNTPQVIERPAFERYMQDTMQWPARLFDGSKLSHYDRDLKDAAWTGWTAAMAQQAPTPAAASEPAAPIDALTDEKILGFAAHAADRIPASNYEGRVLHATRMALRLTGLGGQPSREAQRH